MSSKRTNPAYAYLAYRKAILDYTISHLSGDVIGADGLEPTVHIISEDVFREDEKVPPEDVYSFVEELEEMRAHLVVEMGRFEFVRKEEEDVKGKQRAAGKRPRGKSS